MMEENAIDAVADLAREAIKPQLMKLPGTGRERYVFVDRLGEVDKGKIYVEPRNIKCTSIEGVAQVVKDIATDPDRDGKQIRIGVSSYGVCVTLDERGDRSDTISFDFKIDSSFQWLSCAPSGINQPDLIWEIRSRFPERVDPTFLPVIRKLKFSGNANAASSIHQGRETVDLSVEASVSGIESGDTIAETVTFHTPVFEHMNTAQDSGVFEPVKCAVLVNAQDRDFTIKSLPGELERASRRACRFNSDQLKTLLAGHENVEVFDDTSFES